MEPTFYFVAHVQVSYNTATTQFQRFKNLTAGAVHTDIIKYEDKKYLTFIAHFSEPRDFKTLEGQLRFYYGGKSKVLKVDYSKTDLPTCYYSAYLLPDLASAQKHNGFYETKVALLRTALALIITKPITAINNYECSVVIEFPDHDIREVDQVNLLKAMERIPHKTLMASRPIPKQEE